MDDGLIFVDICETKLVAIYDELLITVVALKIS